MKLWGGGAWVGIVVFFSIALPGAAGTLMTSTFTAAADAWVGAAAPNTNYGASSSLDVDGSPTTESYLRFDVSGVSGAVLSAKLRLYAFDGSIDGPAIYATATGWSESGITWNSRPGRIGGASDDKGAVVTNSWVEWDVTPLVAGNGSFSFGLVPTSTDGVDLYSRNAVANRPEIVVTSSSAPPPDTSAPTVAISEPASGSTYTSAETIAITASASDDVGVAQVEFFDNGVLKGSDIASPWSHTWSFTSADNGPHRWTAKAYDTAGNGAESAPVDLNVAIAQGRTSYYVDAFNGSDSNAGTSENAAWRTLSKASAASLAPGDRLLFKRGGTWWGTLDLAQSGTVSERIEIGAYGSGALPMITGAEKCVRVLGSYVTLVALHLHDCAWAGADVSGSGTRIERSLITRNAAGIHIRPGAVGTVVRQNELRDNNKMSVNTPGGDDDSGAFGVLIEGDNAEIAYNRISGSDAFSYDYGRDGAAIEIFGGTNNEITYNVAVDNQAFAELGGSRTSDNSFGFNEARSSLTTSIAFVTRGASNGFGPVHRTALYNNTVYSTGSSSRGVICEGGCGPDILRMRNNIVQTVSTALQVDAAFDEDYNLFYGGPIMVTQGSHSLVADPEFVDPAGGNLRLRASSPAIDHGTDTGYQADLDGVALPQDGDGDGVGIPDIGAHEYAPGGIPCAVATYRFEAVEDAEVLRGAPDANSGGGWTVRSDLDYTGGLDAEALFKFGVTGIPEGCAVSSAVLRTYVTSGVRDNGPYAHATAVSWSEYAVTWNTKPPLEGAALGNAGPVAGNDWTDFDVTAAVTGNGTYSFTLKPESPDGFAAHSRENTNRPTLVVTTAAQ